MHPNRSGSRLAVIDLGSNTFHLLIVQKQKAPPYFRVLHRERAFIYISADGIELIPAYKIERALECLHGFRKTIDEFDCDHIEAVGTAALRSARNGTMILEKIKQETGVTVRTINGEEEARLIFEGTQCLARTLEDPAMIMDIGGGSVEFVIQAQVPAEILEFQSHDLGISVLRKNFVLSEPVKPGEVQKLGHRLDSALGRLTAMASEKKVKWLIGSSGPFEIMESMQGDAPSIKGNAYNRKTFDNIKQKVLSRDKEGRAMLEGMPAQRSDLAKEAFLLIDYIMGACPGIQQILVSPYAIKEGLILKYFRPV